MDLSEIIKNAVDNKIQQIVSAATLAGLFILLVLTSGGGIIESFGVGWSIFKSWLLILSGIGTIVLCLGIYTLFSKFSDYLNNIKF